MQDHFDTLEKRLASIDITLVRNTVALEEHMRRTTMLEKQMEPVKRHVAMVEGALKLVGGLMVVAELIKLFWGTK